MRLGFPDPPRSPTRCVPTHALTTGLQSSRPKPVSAAVEADECCEYVRGSRGSPPLQRHLSYPPPANTHTNIGFTNTHTHTHAHTQSGFTDTHTHTYSHPHTE
eukprot:GHVR01134651.1.p1 GENE.GHVR01134651.1~~GHVR01134651.1.p1  ORF type:complete len:103 (+),score=56.24 GHVR01134651.1:270-578(+)